MISLEEVETLRNMLHDVIRQDKEELILELSRKLDELIVKYYTENNENRN